MKKEFDKIFYTTPEIDRCNEKLWAWTVKKIGNEGTKMYDLGKEVAYNKAIDDCLAILHKYQNGCSINTLRVEMNKLKEKK